MKHHQDPEMLILYYLYNLNENLFNSVVLFYLLLKWFYNKQGKFLLINYYEDIRTSNTLTTGLPKIAFVFAGAKCRIDVKSLKKKTLPK